MMPTASFTSFDDLQDHLTSLLASAVAQDFPLPLYIVAVAANGTIITARMVLGVSEGAGLETEFLTERIVPPGLTLPINLFLVVSDGRADRMLIETETETQIGSFPVSRLSESSH